MEMLPAAHGDALLIEWGKARKPRRMLVDAGPLGTYPGIYDRMKSLDKRQFELLIVTHIDGDHIEGVVRLLQDRESLGVEFGDVWFNGWPQLPKSDRQGADNGEMVGALLRRDGLPWNVAFDGNAAQIPQAGALPTYELEGDARLTLLGPGPAQLKALKATWTKVLTAAGVSPGKPDEALARLAKRKDLSGLDVQGRKAPLDHSVANGSSISVLFEYDGKSLLLTGDGHGDVLVDGIQRLLAERGGDRLEVDAFKLPHHCSRGNVTDDLLGVVATERFLVSTNGARYKHPDREAVLRIVDGPSRNGRVELTFNYLSDTTRPWARPSTARKYDYTPVFPDKTTAGAVVEV